MQGLAIEFCGFVNKVGFLLQFWEEYDRVTMTLSPVSGQEEALMNCKFCGAQMGEDEKICPCCGKDNTLEETNPVEETTPAEEVTLAEETVDKAVLAEQIPEEELYKMLQKLKKKQNKKKKMWIPIVAIVCCVALLLGLGAGVWYEINGGWVRGENNVHFRNNYTRSDFAVKLAANRVVARYGDKTLTNRQLQALYWLQFYNFYSEYGNTGSLDFEKPFADQRVPGSNGEDAVSWEQYFIELALENWYRYQLLVADAEEKGKEMPEDYYTFIENLPKSLEKNVQNLGYKDVEDYVDTMMGKVATAEDYLDYLDLSNRGEYYFKLWFAETEVTRDEVSAFFDEKAEAFKTQYGITKETGLLVDVRHVLIQPEGATLDSYGRVTAATDAQWEACRAQAQALLDEWKKDGTEEAFIKLASEKSQDEVSKKEGGLCAYVAKGDMVEEFDAWLFEEGRKEGDFGLVKTVFGYHLMYYVGGDEAWYLCGKDELIVDRCQKQLEEMVENVTRDVDYSAIVLGKANIEKMVG